MVLMRAHKLLYRNKKISFQLSLLPFLPEALIYVSLFDFQSGYANGMGGYGGPRGGGIDVSS